MKLTCILEGLGSLDQPWGYLGSVLGLGVGKGVGGLSFFNRLLVTFWGPWGDLLVTFGVLGADLEILNEHLLKMLPWIDWGKTNADLC